jgi:hypothetical protein
MKKRLKVAKERIQEFKLLNSIFDNFNAYETAVSSGTDLPKNVIFNLFATNNYQGNPGTHGELNDLEIALSCFFNHNSVTKTEYREFVKRLTSRDNFESIEAYDEISIGYQIANKIGFDKVNLHAKLPNGKKPDFLIDLGEKKTVMELTALNLSTPELIINEIVSEITRYILDKCEKIGFLITILLDALSIISKDIDGNIDIKKSISVICSKINDLHLEDLVGFKGSIDFEGGMIKFTEKQANIIFPEKEKAIIWIDKNSKQTSVFAAHYMRLVNSSESVLGSKSYSLFESWAKKVLLKDFLNSPFESASYSPHVNSCVYVNSIEFNSNDDNLRKSSKLETSRAVKEGFLQHIRRSIEKKIKKGQYERSFPFIIVIRAEDWRFEYEFDYDDFIPLRNKVQDLLKEFPDVSGVILFTRDIYLGRFIENPIASESIKKEDFEKYDILSKREEPLITHDRKIDFGKLDSESKKNRIKEILEMESKFDLHKGTKFTHYASGDLEELFKELNEFLYEKEIEQELLDLIDVIIKKYCTLKKNDENDHEAEERDDPILGTKMIVGGSIPLRAYASTCQILYTRHRPTSRNITLCLSLAEDSNTYVRMDVCKVLNTLYEINPKHALDIAKRYCLDNKFVRFYLPIFLGYLTHKNKAEAINIFRIVIKEYGKKNLTGRGEDNLLLDVVSIVTKIALLCGKDYYELFNEILSDEEYNISLKKEIISTMREERFILDPILSDRIIKNYMILLNHSSFEVKANVDFFPLYTLVQKKISLFPRISNLIDAITKIKYPNPIIGLDNTYHFEILQYLETFCSEFPQYASRFLISITDLNPFLLRSFHAHSIVRTLGILLDNIEIEKDTKMNLVCILKKIDSQIYREVEQILDKLRKSDSNFSNV